jgi:N-acetylmuramoyl-L-alanine amidase
MPPLRRRSIPLLVGLALFCLVSKAASLSPVYQVQKGDSLWSIARLFDTTVSDIRKLNSLKSNRIVSGQLLVVGPSIDEIQAPNGPYYFRKPKAEVQESATYLERSTRSPRNDYINARNLIHAFEAQTTLASRAYKGKKPLRGWRVVLDPGHGGVDPGAIVSNRDGDNKSIYVVEDEYVYDIALRIYERLHRLGADVELTVISPNHAIRDNLMGNITFVHESNEVYNDERWNRKNEASVRPRGQNLDTRVNIANRFFRGAGRKTLFVSIHADNSPERPKGPLAIYHSRKGKTDRKSRRFAKVMQKALDQPNLTAQIMGRNLAVLRDNKASAEILVEIRNVSDKGEAWAIRYHKNRQKDAERIVKGIVDYVGE